MSFKINKISNYSLGTHYGIFENEKLIHYEFSYSAADLILKKLQNGKTLNEALMVEPVMVPDRLIKSHVSRIQMQSFKTPIPVATKTVQKTKYDRTLYHEIKKLKVNEIVQVTNRKGQKSTIHITNIVELTWHQLQLLVAGGSNKLEKQYLLYEEYSAAQRTNNLLKGVCLSQAESSEIKEYIDIFEANGFSMHTQVNDYITGNDLWKNFPNIRSLNDHGEFKEIKGIEPKYFEIICSILNISGEGGRRLDSFKKY